MNSFPDPTSGSGKMMIVNGPIDALHQYIWSRMDGRLAEGLQVWAPFMNDRL